MNGGAFNLFKSNSLYLNNCTFQDIGSEKKGGFAFLKQSNSLILTNLICENISSIA